LLDMLNLNHCCLLLTLQAALGACRAHGFNQLGHSESVARAQGCECLGGAAWPPTKHKQSHCPHIYQQGGQCPGQSSEGRKAASVVGPQPTPDDHKGLSQGLVDWVTELPHT